MGMEWHNRKRSSNGRFARRNEAMAKAGQPRQAQIHIRLPFELAVRLRAMAIAEQQEITTLCEDLIECYVEEWEEDQQSAKG